jgi:hypothetical protein
MLEWTKKYAGELFVFTGTLLICSIILGFVIREAEKKRQETIKEMSKPLSEQKTGQKIFWGASTYTMDDANKKTRTVMLGFREDGVVLWGLGQEVSPAQGQGQAQGAGTK